jgi:hypothetical protein
MYTRSYRTIKSFDYIHQLAIVKGLLESEGIECFVVDEYTTQVNPLFSNAIGGIKLQVDVNDFPRAKEILENHGHLFESEIQPSKWLVIFDKLSSQVPIINKVKTELRLLLLVIVLVTFSIFILSYSTLFPSDYEKLTSKDWCIDWVEFKSVKYAPQTDQLIRIFGTDGCNDNISFRDDGTVWLPGFKTGPVRGEWKLIDDALYIMKTDNFKAVYNGIYTLHFSNNGIILTSRNTIIHGY